MSKAMEIGQRIVKHLNGIESGIAVSHGHDPMTLDELAALARGDDICYAHTCENFLVAVNMGSVFLFDIRKMTGKDIENILGADSIAIVDDAIMGIVDACVCQLASCNY